MQNSGHVIEPKVSLSFLGICSGKSLIRPLRRKIFPLRFVEKQVG